jgi:hypothetical protein
MDLSCHQTFQQPSKQTLAPSSWKILPSSSLIRNFSVTSGLTIIHRKTSHNSYKLKHLST